MAVPTHTNEKRSAGLSFEKGCKALSVTFGDSSPKGRAKACVRSSARLSDKLKTNLVFSQLRMRTLQSSSDKLNIRCAECTPDVYIIFNCL